MKPSLIKQILFDFFDGKYTSIQRKMIEEWLSHEENRELYYNYLDEWESHHPQYIVNTERGFKKVYHNLNTFTVDESEDEINVKPFSSWRLLSWLVAASIILTGAYFSWSYLSKPSIISYRHLVETAKDKTGEIYEKKNVSDKPILVNLPDKSSIILQPKSKISYSPNEYNKAKREVILSGEAFFEVQKNSNAPFFVYANNLITKVLGTSFSVSARPTDPETEVIVKTGKVAVFMQNDLKKAEKLNSKSLKGLVLVANEKVKVNRSENTISRPITINIAKLPLPIQRLSFNFDETPVTDVLETLQKAYAVRIIYDKSKLANCKLTAYLSDEPLIEKIKLICIALDADYEEKDAQLIIKSNGCN